MIQFDKGRDITLLPFNWMVARHIRMRRRPAAVHSARTATMLFLHFTNTVMHTHTGQTGPMSGLRFLKKAAMSCSFLHLSPKGQTAPLSIYLHYTELLEQLVLVYNWIPLGPQHHRGVPSSS